MWSIWAISKTKLKTSVYLAYLTKLARSKVKLMHQRKTWTKNSINKLSLNTIQVITQVMVQVTGRVHWKGEKILRTTTITLKLNKMADN